MSNMLIWYLISIILAVVLIVLTILFVFKNRRKLKQNVDLSGLVEALGGIDNIYGITLSNSRINLCFNDKKLLNKEAIKANGVETLVISNKKITLVIGKNAQKMYNNLINYVK